MPWIYISSASDLYIQHIGYTSPINGVNISFVFDKIMIPHPAVNIRRGMRIKRGQNVTKSYFLRKNIMPIMSGTIIMAAPMPIGTIMPIVTASIGTIAGMEP